VLAASSDSSGWQCPELIITRVGTVLQLITKKPPINASKAPVKRIIALLIRIASVPANWNALISYIPITETKW